MSTLSLRKQGGLFKIVLHLFRPQRTCSSILQMLDLDVELITDFRNKQFQHFWNVHLEKRLDILEVAALRVAATSTFL